MYYIAHLIIEAALAVLLVCAAFVIIVAIKRALTCPPKSSCGVQVITVLAARGSAASLEQTVRALPNDTVVIADCGLSPDARRMAELFARERGNIELCAPEDIPKLLEECGWTGENTYA